MWLVSYMSFLTFVSNIVFVAILLGWKKVSRKVIPVSLELSLAISVVATIGSLYMSNIVYLTPCELCWFQRIFMYPLVIIFLIARFRKIPRIWEIALPFTYLGGLTSIYHYLVQIFPKVSETCGSLGSCTAVPFKDFGYITIPWMSLSAFVYITFLMWVYRKKELGKTTQKG